MIVNYVIMVFSDMAINITICFDFLVVFSILLFISHIAVQTSCKALRLYTWKASLISVLLSTTIALFASNSQLVTDFKHMTQELELPIPIYPILSVVSYLWIIIMFFRVGTYIYHRRRFVKSITSSPFIDYDKAYEKASELIEVKNIKCITVTSLNSIGVYGFLKPIILIPKNFIDQYSEEDRLWLYLHELIHIQRKDYLVYTIIEFVKVLCYMHIPLKWQLDKLELCIEQRCDNSVMKVYSNRFRYAGLIINVAKNYNSIPVPFYSESYYSINQRIKALLNRKSAEAVKIAILIIIFISTLLLPYKFNDLEAEEYLKTALVIENLDNTLEIIPIDNIEEAKSIIKLIDTEYKHARTVEVVWEGMFAVYSNGETLNK